MIRYLLPIIFVFVSVADTCHDIDKHDALQDIVNRWLDTADMREFNILSQNWQREQFISTNPCIRFEIKEDTHLTAVFEEFEEQISLAVIPKTDMQKAVRLADEWMEDATYW